MFAEIGFATLVLSLAYSKTRSSRALMLVLGIGIIISHYIFGYLILVLLIATIIVRGLEAMLNQTLVAHVLTLDDRAPSVVLSVVFVLGVILTTWYLNLASGITINQLVIVMFGSVQRLVSFLYEGGFSTQAISQAGGPATSLARSVFQDVMLFLTCLIGIGLASVWIRGEDCSDPVYRALSTAMFGLTGVVFVVPVLSSAIGTKRFFFFQISLRLLAPYGMIGIRRLVEIMLKFRDPVSPQTGWRSVATALLMIWFVFSTGIVYVGVGATPVPFALAPEMNTHGSYKAGASHYRMVHTYEQDLEAISWGILI